jgi:uncharacterized small protein (DUF1192 family)
VVKKMKDQILLTVEELEERIAPSVNGTGGYDGQPGNQNSAKHNPSGSANPENKSGNWGVWEFNKTERRWIKMKDQIELQVEELEERIAPSATGNPGNNNPGENNTNNPGNQPKDGKGNW